MVSMTKPQSGAKPEVPLTRTSQGLHVEVVLHLTHDVNDILGVLSPCHQPHQPSDGDELALQSFAIDGTTLSEQLQAC